MREPLGRFWQLIVDHRIDVLYVKASRRNVGRQQDRHAAGPEVGHDPLARVLAQVALQRRRGIAQFDEPQGQLLDPMLGSAEHDHWLIAASIE